MAQVINTKGQNRPKEEAKKPSVASGYPFVSHDSMLSYNSGYSVCSMYSLPRKQPLPAFDAQVMTEAPLEQKKRGFIASSLLLALKSLLIVTMIPFYLLFYRVPKQIADSTGPIFSKFIQSIQFRGNRIKERVSQYKKAFWSRLKNRILSIQEALERIQRRLVESLTKPVDGIKTLFIRIQHFFRKIPSNISLFLGKKTEQVKAPLNNAMARFKEKKEHIKLSLLKKREAFSGYITRITEQMGNAINAFMEKSKSFFRNSVDRISKFKDIFKGFGNKGTQFLTWLESFKLSFDFLKYRPDFSRFNGKVKKLFRPFAVAYNNLTLYLNRIKNRLQSIIERIQYRLSKHYKKWDDRVIQPLLKPFRFCILKVSQAYGAVDNYIKKLWAKYVKNPVETKIKPVLTHAKAMELKTIVLEKSQVAQERVQLFLEPAAASILNVVYALDRCVYSWLLDVEIFMRDLCLEVKPWFPIDRK